MDNKKIKIVHIAQANGGVEVYLKMFFKYIDKDIYDNYIILSEQYKKSSVYFEKLGVKVFIVDMNREINPIKDFKAMINIHKILKYIKPDIVYTHSSKAGGLGRIPSKLVGAKNIYNPHGWAFDMNVSTKKRILFKYFEKILGYFTDNIIAISEYEKDRAINERIVKNNKISVVENAIDLEKFKKKYDSKLLLDELNWSEDCIVIGMVARLAEQKSPSTFVDIAIKLAKKYPNCRFLMVGDGDQREEIENKIKNNNLETKFHITGWVDDPYKYLDIFDIALLTSRWEGFGLVIPEYMAASKPVVASNVGGIPNIIDNGINGFVIDDLDVNKFVEKIEIIINDEMLRESFINLALEKVKSKYDFNRNISEHVVVFNRQLKICNIRRNDI